MQPSAELTVVIADDHTMVREAFAALWTKIGMRVVGQTADGQTAVELVLELKPDFAILDLDLPDICGTRVVRKLRAEGCSTKMLILTLSKEEKRVREAIRAGADGYLLKDGVLRDFEDAIKTVQEGAVYLAPRLRGGAVSNQSERPSENARMAKLSPRETEIVRYLVNGRRAKEIAEILDISPKTFDTYLSSIKRKLIDPEDSGPSAAGAALVI